MIGLTGTRVIIVDDEEEEALPMMKAFAKEGIPTAFFDGRIHGLPPKRKRFSGIRLAILDMDLIGGGVPDATKSQALVKVLSSILSPENGPYAVLAWTKHPEIRELFEQHVFARPDVPKPIVTVTIEKAAFKKPKGAFDLVALSKEIKSAVSQTTPLLLLQTWEGNSFEAATAVTNALSAMASEAAGDLQTWRDSWRQTLMRLIFALAKSVGEKGLDADSSVRSFYTALNPLHSDRIESNTAQASKFLKTQGAEILAAAQDCGAERKARVNAMLHLATENLDQFAPGNIYKYSENRNPRGIPKSGDLLDEIIQPNQPDAARARILGASVRLLTEASAPCDHAQQNIRLSRLIAGLAVPIAEIGRIKKGAGFIWSFGPVFLDVQGHTTGQYQLFFSARHVISPDVKHIRKKRAVIRLRGQALADLQSWFGHHVSRPGVMLLN
jgi:hypothetical protein